MLNQFFILKFNLSLSLVHYHIYVKLQSTINLIYVAQVEAIENVHLHEVYSMSTSTCLVIGKDAYKTQQVTSCERKLRNFYCDDISNSIIFLLSKFLV